MNTKIFLKKYLGPYMPRYKEYKRQYEYLKKEVPSFYKELNGKKENAKNLLFVSMGSYDAKTEALYLKVYQSLGYRVNVICFYDPYVEKIFSLYGIEHVYFFENYLSESILDFKKDAELLLSSVSDVNDLLKVKRNGVHFGKYAASSYMRKTRSSDLNYSENEKPILIDSIAESLRVTNKLPSIFNDFNPDTIIVIDRGYTPVGQIFEYALNTGVEVISKNGAHKSGFEILKRYLTPEDSIIHPQSLSEKSWNMLQRMEFTKYDEKRLLDELFSLYDSGDWFSEVGTQFNKKILSKDELKTKLGIDLNKKVACIFPHMFWDATFFWGEDIFDNYYDWFVNVLRVAKENTRINWLIKIHPANIVKAKRDKYIGKTKEIQAIYDTLGSLPDHIKLIDSDSEISTYSLFSILDYSLTVRGTVGIETAMLGVTTITAGTGRYDKLGFTYDFANKDEYLHFLKELEQVPSMTPSQIELARRFAYGVFILRPIKIDVADIVYKQDEIASMSYIPVCRDGASFFSSHFYLGLKKFIENDDLDFLNVGENNNGIYE